MVISVADASTWLSICYQWVIENIYFIAFLTLYPQECSILPADLKQTQLRFTKFEIRLAMGSHQISRCSFLETAA